MTPADSVGELLATRLFAVGLAYGAIAYLVTAVVAVLRRRADGLGMAFGVAVMLAVQDSFGPAAPSFGFVAALAVLALGGTLAIRMRPRTWARWHVWFTRTAVALAPGAALVGLTFPVRDPSWMPAVAAGVTWLVATLVHDFDRAQREPGAPFLFLAIACAAVYMTAPDTELPLMMVGVAIPLVLVSVPQPLRRLGPAGSTVAVAVFVWIVAAGARGEGSSFILGVAALGVMALEPLGRRVPRSTPALPRKRRRSHAERPHQERWSLVVGVAVLAQVVFVLYLARLAALDDAVLWTTLAVAPAVVLLVAASPALLPVDDRKLRVRRRPNLGFPGIPRRRRDEHAGGHRPVRR